MKPRIPIPLSLAGEPFTAARGLDAGLGRHRMRGGDLAHPFRGVFDPRTDALDVVGLCGALQQRLPPDAFFSGITAAVVMGVPLPACLERSRTLHVAVPAPRRAPTGRGLVGHSFQVSDGDLRTWRGLRIAGPELAWCELSNTLELSDLVAAGDFLIHWRLPYTTTHLLGETAARYPSRQGRPARTEALPLLHDRSESRRESKLRVILVRGGVHGLEVNHPITTTGGFTYRADLAFPECKVIVEYQSAYHETPVQFRRDMTRISRLEADGWIVIQVNGDDLENPAELLARITRVLLSRVAR